MNPVLILTRNNLELTKRTVESIEKQMVHAEPVIIDNGSEDGTPEWASAKKILFGKFPFNAGVSAGWNAGLAYLFDFVGCAACVCVGNDTVLPPWFCAELWSYDVPFVSGVAVDDMAMISAPPMQRMPLAENPDFSAYMISRECWKKVGPFDERMKLYASDCDFHVRAHKLGMPLYKACVPYYHERSSTLNNASPEERYKIETQANEDRAVFRKLWGCLPGTPEYSALFL